ncbi:MAG: homoserine O-acetyltransferase, partial [Propionibacterium sp.]
MNRADLGAVTTQRLSVGSPTEPFVCASGAELPGIEIAFETYGELNDDRSNAVYVCHALTGDAHAAAHHDGDRPGWWGNLIGPGKPLDTDRFFVICANLLGGCQGTTGPASINPETDRVYGLEFPLLQVSDFVSAHREVIKSLGISKLAAAIGGSLGGMQVLDWSLSHPEELGAAVIIAASSRLTAQNIAFSAVARSAIMRDPNFQEGRFLDNGTRPDLGLAIARMMAHITYLSEPAMSEKFGRTMTDQASPGFGTDFQVESYLNHQGKTFLNRFDALSYLYLTRAM